jgi:hypothetical protein
MTDQRLAVSMLLAGLAAGAAQPTEIVQYKLNVVGSAMGTIDGEVRIRIRQTAPFPFRNLTLLRSVTV